ncbi:MAG: restriction endonuclease subunit S [Rhodocyclaceae bacterium]|nr:restriction endonuclease subunit S [Rhodocyclaceae bacterium]
MDRFDLPEGWEWRELHEIATVDSRQINPSETPNTLFNYVGLENIASGTNVLSDFRPTIGSSIKSNKNRFDQRHVLYGKLRPYLNKVHLPAFEGICSTDILPLLPKPEIVSRDYLGIYLRTPGVIEYTRSKMDGAKMPRLRTPDLRALLVPVAPILEQHRIVARVDAQFTRCEIIRKAQREHETELRGILAGYYAEICADAGWKPMAEVAPQARRPVSVKAGKSYPELGIRSFGKGTFHKPAISAEQLGSKRIYHIQPGDLIFNNVFAWEGAVAVVKPEDSGRVGSHRFITCVPKADVATTPFLYFHFTTEQGLHDLGDASPGGAGRNRTLGLAALGNIRVPVPDYDKQVQFARLWEKVEITRRLQAELAADLAAYVPAVLDKAFRGEL